MFEDDNEINDDDIYGNIKKNIVPAAYLVPPFVVCFILLCIIVLIIVFFTCRDSSINIFERPLNDMHQSTETQATFFALVVVSVLMTIYIFIMDSRLLSKRDAELSAYYPENGYGFSIPITSFVFSSFSLAVTSVATILFLIWFITIGNSDPISGKINCLCITSLALYFGSTFFQISCHIPSILMAWSTDPFYASKIAVYYAVYIFLNYTASKYTYILSLKLCKSRIYSIVCTIFSVTFVLLLVNGVLVTITIFIVNIPVNNSIEESADGVKSLYNGAILLIGGIIAYNVGWHYFFGSFSFNRAMERAMTEMQIPFNNPSDNAHWQRLTEERRMAEVMKTLISRKTLSRPQYDCSLYSALTNVLINADRNKRRISPTDVLRNVCKNSQKTNPTADQIVSLSTVLYNAINTAVKNAAENDDQKINTLTDALVQVMDKPDFVLKDPRIDLDKAPTDVKLTTLRDTLKPILEAAIGNNPVNLDPNDIKNALRDVLTP